MAKQPSREFLERAATRPAVLAALQARGRLILPRAQRDAAKAGAVEFARRLRLESGTRPGAKAAGGFRRPYVRVVADMPEDARQADSRSRLTRREILRRAAR